MSHTKKHLIFVLGSIAIKRLELIETLQNRTEENIRLDCKLGREGKGYATINNYKNEVGKSTKHRKQQ